MARGRGAGAFVLGMSFAVTGCIYLTDLSGLSGGPPEPDASAPSEGGGSPDGGSPPPSDGSTPLDAGTATRVCEAGTHAFCIDFEDGNLAAPPWSAISSDGLLVIEDGPSVSPPKALHSTLPARGDVNQILRNRALKTWPGGWRPVHVELDVFVVRPAWRVGDTIMNLVEVSLASDTEGAGVALFVGPNGALASPSKAGEPNVEGAAFPYDVWTHVVIDVELTHFRVAFAERVLEASHAAPTPGPNANVVAFFGLSSYSDPICAFDARFDNIVVDFK